jgi:SRSO17 transposase
VSCRHYIPQCCHMSAEDPFRQESRPDRRQDQGINQVVALSRSSGVWVTREQRAAANKTGAGDGDRTSAQHGAA